MTPLRRWALLLLPLVLIAFVPAAGQPAPGAGRPPETVTGPWADLDRLIWDQKMKEALPLAERLLSEARTAGDQPAWTRALARTVQIRMALGSFEEGLASLDREPWPADPVDQAILHLFRAQALERYFSFYTQEILARERIDSRAPVGVERWTREQFGAAILAESLAAWREREALGREPVARWTDFFEPGTYPAEVRGTLRDTVSYQFAELLQDRQFWSPREESNGLARLDARRLMAGTDLAATPERLADPGIHPAEKAAAVLLDLEAWHLAEGNRAGALEAHLERFRQLREIASRKADRQELIAGLEQHLAAYRDIPWWSMGMFALSESLADLERARAVAQEGYEAYPDSPGGVRCRQRVQGIELPGFEVRAMESDGPDRRSIEVRHKNLPALFFRAYRRQASELLLRRWVRERPEKAAPEASWRVDLPPTPDFQRHRTYVTPPLGSGAYEIRVSTGEGFDPEKDRIESLEMVLGDLVLVARSMDPEKGGLIEVLALSGETGRPVPGVAVEIYEWDRASKGSQLRKTALSDAEGRVRFASASGQSLAFLGRRGKDLAWIPGFFANGRDEDEEEVSGFLYTDRGVYRPGQKVFWKVVSFQRQEGPGRFQARAGAAVRVVLSDAQGQAVAEQTATTGAFGTVSGEFTLPPGRPLGGWSLESSDGASASIQVEEYKRPTFEVSFDDPAEPLRLGHPAALTGRVLYYFGLPVTHGQVKWSVSREPVYTWTWGVPFNGNNAVVATGVTDLAADGTFRVEFTPEESEAEPEEPWRDRLATTYSYLVEAEVTDEGGENRLGKRDLRVGPAAVEARIGSESGFFRAGRPAVLTVLRTDLQGIPRPGEGRWTLVELRQPAAPVLPADLPPDPFWDWWSGAAVEPLTPGDAVSPRWREYRPEEMLAAWPEGRQVAAGMVRHGADGRAEVSLPADLPPGAYRLLYETADDFGAPSRAASPVLIAGGSTPLALPALLSVEQSTVQVGGTARLFVHSGFPGQILWLETYRAGKLAERRRLTAGISPEVIEIPVRQEDRGGFAVRLLALRDHQLFDLKGSVRVPWDDRQLRLELSSFRDKVRPGARETWRVTVRGEGAHAVTAELLASMYDRSLDAFWLYEPPDLLGLYPDRRAIALLQASLGSDSSMRISKAPWPPVPPYIPEMSAGRLRLFDGWAIGGPGGRRVLTYVRPYLEWRMAQRATGGIQISVGAQFSSATVAEQIVVTSEDFETQGAPPPPPPPPPPLPQTLRRDFSETAFWYPHLITGPDGSATIEVTVPDSLTSWSLWIHALTKDLRAGSLHRELRSARELMVRPYLPRFLREGDRADLKVVVNNAAEGRMQGEVAFDLLDPETGASRLADFGLQAGAARLPFSAEPGSGATVLFPLTVPPGVGPVQVRVTATAGDLSDGELRDLPILPSRLRLAQSRTAAVRDGESRTLRFEDLEKGGDPTRENERLVVTVDGQLFYGVLEALPYLVDYPYECTEQTLNRFLSTAVVSSVFERYPAVAAMAQELAKRETAFEAWGEPDPNRRMALEETPWLDEARGGRAPQDDQGVDLPLIKVLDPRVAKAERETALKRLQEAQLPEGAFPWWPGGPASPAMTLYLVHGFARAAEHGAEVPKEPVRQAWGYLGRYFRSDLAAALAKDEVCCWESLTFLAYTATSFPDPSWSETGLTAEEQGRIVEASFRHWREQSPYLKAMLALALQRRGRTADARLILDSILDSATTTPEEGTFWQPSERSWLWYNDTVESHAFILRALLEIAPDDPRRHGLAQWLFLNKKLNHWKSTRATAEAIHALTHYLEKEGQLGTPEEIAVRTSGREASYVFAPDRYTGKKNQLVVEGKAIDPARSAVVVEPKTPGLFFASATWHFSTAQPPAEERGDLLGVSRRYFRRDTEGGEAVLRPLGEGAELRPGDEIEVQLTVRSRAAMEYVHLRDPRPAGFEPGVTRSGYRWDGGLGYFVETRDSGTHFFFERLPAGEYTLRYRVRASVAGTFQAGPATLQSMYAPEITAYSAGETVRVR